MVNRLLLLIPVIVLIAGVASDVVAIDGGKRAVSYKVLPVEQQRLLNDPPAAHLASQGMGVRQDTLWFGGLNPATGLAYRGTASAIWDFEDCTLQGWFCEDVSAAPLYFRHVTPDSFVAHGDTDYEDSAMGVGSVWCGAFLDESEEGCWPGGRGYSNGWGQFWRKEFTYGGGGAVTLGFDYFVDSEQDFDFSYVYVFDDGGVKSDPLNTCQYPNSQESGYSGSNAEGSGIGAPENPASEQIIVNAIWLPDSADRPFEVEFNFDSDPLFSDGLDSWGGFLNSLWGPFGVDNVTLVGTNLNEDDDFNTGADGWTGTNQLPIGCYLEVSDLSELDPVGDPCGCPISGCVMTDADLSGGGNFPHPKKQNNFINSSTCDVSADQARTQFLIQFQAWVDMPRDNGVGFRITLDYYPWTCPETGGVHWTMEPAGDGGFFFEETAGCYFFLVDNSSFMGGVADSIQICFELLGDCDDFGFDPLTCSHETTNQSPYWDNIRLGLLTPVNAPPLSGDAWFQDAYPTGQTLRPDATANVNCFFDRRYSDNDETNADMGDSATVDCGTYANSEVYLNFRVRPGPCMDPNDLYWTRFHCDDQPGGAQLHCPVDCRLEWAAARCDSAEREGGNAPQPGRFMTFFHEDSRYFSSPEGSGSGPDWRLNRDNEILPDGLFMPGTKIEYFFTSHFTGNPWDSLNVDTWPDTSDQFYLEYEVLPGYIRESQDPCEVVAPCLLYVDAFNAGAQEPIERWGLAPVLGTLIDDAGQAHSNWDRYDYMAATSGIPAPLARERFGNNGMTKYQSMIYQTVFYNTGSFHMEGLRNGDADLLIHFLITDDFDRWTFLKGLWLSGNGIVEILDNPVRPRSQALLSLYACAQLDCVCLNEADCPSGSVEDTSICVRVNATVDADFGTEEPEPYAAIRGLGCPSMLCANVIEPTNECGVPNLSYEDQDAGGDVAEYASVSNDQSFGAGNPANYRVVTDAFSLHYMRWVEDPWTIAQCGTTATAITRRCEDVLGWLGAVGSQGCPPDDILSTGIGEQSGVPIARTMLFQNAPNPFNPQTTVRYDLAEKTHVKLQVFDVSGRLVRTLIDKSQAPDTYRVIWDGKTDAGKPVASGVFWVRLSTRDGFDASTKVVLVR